MCTVKAAKAAPRTMLMSHAQNHAEMIGFFSAVDELLVLKFCDSMALVPRVEDLPKGASDDMTLLQPREVLVKDRPREPRTKKSPIPIFKVY